jgi:glycolate oxidase iron-sulfur subunit
VLASRRVPAPDLPPSVADSTPGPAARIAALADQCVLCGACLPHCPTYALDRTEAESPRGRIMLFKSLAEGKLGPDPAAFAHLDHCLACRHCERVCPAQVRYGELLTLGRAAQRRIVAVPLRQRVLEWLLPRRAWLALALRLGEGLRRGVPGPWRGLPALPARRRAPASVPAAGTPSRGRVALFAGCLGEWHEQATVAAAATLLGRLGWQVDVPPAQTCCGATHRHAGADATALAQRNRAAFAAAPAAVLTLASGCHETIAQQLAGVAPVRDALDFLHDDERLSTLRFRPAHGTRVALQLPCTQRNLLRNGARVASLLRRVPGLELVLLDDAGCCGAAGSHMLLEPRRAAALREPWLNAIAASGVATLCSANVGCRLHLGAGLAARGTTRVVHPLQLLAEHLE